MALAFLWLTSLIVPGYPFELLSHQFLSCQDLSLLVYPTCVTARLIFPMHCFDVTPLIKTPVGPLIPLTTEVITGALHPTLKLSVAASTELSKSPIRLLVPCPELMDTFCFGSVYAGHLEPSRPYHSTYPYPITPKCHLLQEAFPHDSCLP